MGKIRTIDYGSGPIHYDEDTPCSVCGEPIIGASMAGVGICPSCDLGRCRYCGVRVAVFKESVDCGRSIKDFRDHIKWHKEHTPDIVQETNDAHRRRLDKLERVKHERKNTQGSTSIG